MALFPKATFEILVHDGAVVPGAQLAGQLVVRAPEAIPRAEHVDMTFRSVAWAGYGSGKSRSVVRRVMFDAPLRVDVPGKTLPAGTHTFPFAVDVPPWLPPALRGPDCAIVHEVQARVDVDWAVDPTATVWPNVVLMPVDGVRTAASVRSPVGFHDTIVVEVTLPSSVITHDEPLIGQIALRGGHDARFDAIELSMAGIVTVTMARGDRRRSGRSTVRIPDHALRSGEPVPFRFEPTPHILPTFRNAFLDHDVVLTVSVDVPWAIDPSFEVPLHVLPRGSVVHGESTAAAVGSDRLRLTAAAMASAVGFGVARAPRLLEGAVGAVGVTVTDAPYEGRLGVDVDFTFPSLHVDIAMRPLGMLDGFRDSPLLPRAFRDRYLLRCAEARVDDAALASLFEVMLDGLAGAEALRLSDHHLGFHLFIANDEGERMVAVAREVREKARAIGEAIARLPFPPSLAGARPAWEATAVEQSAILVPSGPSLHGIALRARVLGGEERVVPVAIRTRWSEQGPRTCVDLDLRACPLPKEGVLELVGEHGPRDGRVRAAYAVFGGVQLTATSLTLEHGAWTPDPRVLLSPVESLFGWILDVRGERRVDAPYR